VVGLLAAASGNVRRGFALPAISETPERKETTMQLIAAALAKLAIMVIILASESKDDGHDGLKAS
jgi:hypothetical protein